MAIHKIKPSSKDYLWGGTKLIEFYDKSTDKEIMAESWEISSHPDGPSYIIGGEFDGMTLADYAAKFKTNVMGKNSERFPDFPVLIKFIDAADALSIQVHPDDEYALEYEKQFGKNEMWYILEAEPNSFLYYGVAKDLTKDQFREAIENNEILDVLNQVEVKPGDVVYVKAGTLHAIGKGIVLCEIQQNSNVTYRVYDFNRRGADGKLRDLHIDQAVEVSNLTKTSTDFSPQGIKETYDGFTRQCLVSCEYFITTIYNVESKARFTVDDKSFCSVVCLEGELEFKTDDNTTVIKKGESLFIDANTGIINVEGKGNFIHVVV